MTAPAPEVCDVCGASPVEMVLYPVAIHYKGSGFYSTDYGKGKAAKAKDSAGGDSGSSSSSDSGGTSDKSPSTGSSEKKAATSD